MKKYISIVLLASTIFSQNADSLFKESQNALSNGDLKLAGEKINAAINADNSNQIYREEEKRLRDLVNKLNNSNRALQDGRFDDAISGFSDLTKDVPKLTDAFYGSGKAYEGKSDYSKAVSFYKEALKIDSNHENSRKSISNVAKRLYNEANQDYKNGNLESAMNKYNQVIDINPKLYQAYFQMGVLYKRMGNISSSIDNYKKALDIKKNFDKGWYALGLAYKDNGDINNAKNAFEQTIKLNSKYAKAHKSLGEIYLDSENFENALTSFQNAVKIESDFSSAYHAMGITYSKMGDYKKSVEALEQASKLDKKEFLIWFDLSASYNALNMCDKAKTAAQESIDLKKNFGGGWFELGIAEYCNGSGNKNLAINHFEKARNDRDWRKMAEYEIDKVRNPQKYDQ